MNIQGLIHWLEEGKGGSWIRCGAAIVFVVLLSVLLGYKRYQGPADESIFLQALMGQSLAEGEGFKTGVYYPQAIAFLESRSDFKFERDQTLPELYHAPLYSLVIAGVIAALPESLEQRFWVAPGPSSIFGADFLLFGINCLFFWVAALFLWLSARRLFSESVAWVALAAMILSEGCWARVIDVSGTSLLMALVALLVYFLVRVEFARRRGKSVVLGAAVCGLLLGAMFLTEYSALFGGVAVLFYLIFFLKGSARWFSVGSLLCGCLLVSVPYMVRNVQLTGHPVALAGENLFLKVDDRSAMPHKVRNVFVGELENKSLRKVAHKGVHGLKLNLRERLWSGGAFFFTAFFACGLFYRFKNPEADLLRWLLLGFVALLVLGQPFFNSGESLRLPTTYLVPILVLFGSGFLHVLIDSTRQRGTLERRGLLLIVVLAQALPLVHLVLEPKVQAHYSYPPYFPRVMHLVKPGLKEKFHPNFGLMADVPAGLAWYSGEAIWSQPLAYADFVSVVERQAIGALYLSPSVLDRPYFSELLQEGGDSLWEDPRKNFSWGAVYAGLPSRTMPSFFPLQNPIRFWDNTYVLIDPRAQKKR